MYDFEGRVLKKLIFGLSASMRLSALSLEIRVFEILPMENPGFFLNADILIEGIRIKPKNPDFLNSA